MKIKRFNESNSIDIFSDVSILEDILLEYTDLGLEYKIELVVFIDYQNLGLVPAKKFHSYTNYNDLLDDNPDYKEDKWIKSYVVSFNKLNSENEIFASDQQRSDDRKMFRKPSKQLFDFFSLIEETQHRIEDMGYRFGLSSSKHGEYSFIILENK